jgi:molybdate transport system substrate-binding protein
MMPAPRLRVLAVAAAVSLAVVACRLSAAPSSPAPVELTIFAAASLKDALARAKTAYEADNPGTTLVITTDSSAALELKIEQGAPADLFLAADTSNPQKLVDGGFAAGLPVEFAGNELVIVVPASVPNDIQVPVGLLAPGVRIIAAGDDVPITKYANQVFDNLSKLPGYPADFAARYASNVVSREENVRAVLAKIELGEGDAAIVYNTDALASKGVARIEIPAAANVRAAYAGVAVKGSAHAGVAADFLDWLVSGAGQEVLAQFGFLPPAPP